MAVKKIITSTIPNTTTKHFWQLDAVRPYATTLTELSRQAMFEGKLLSVGKYKSALTVRNETVWISREECDRQDQLLFTAHPDYVMSRDAYNQANGISWVVTYEEV